MNPLRHAARSLRREFFAGDLLTVAAALVLGVAAMTAVGFLTDRVQQALDREASQLLGGDLLLRADHPWPEAVRGAYAIYAGKNSGAESPKARAEAMRDLLLNAGFALPAGPGSAWRIERGS